MRLLSLCVGLSLCAAVAACATGSSGGATGDSGESGGGAGAGAGAGGGGARGDAFPAGAVSFFQVPACPDGWKPHAAAEGRLLLATVGDSAPGTTYGEPLASGEDRAHTHGVGLTFDLGAVSYAGVAGGGNKGVGAAGMVMFNATSEATSTGLPYVQLLACKKIAEPVPASKPLPAGLTMFFDGPSCPDGFKQSAATQGRFIVGLPSKAPADVSFGGPPLPAAEKRKHAHGNTATLATSPHGIALASGCCADGYAKDGMYTATQDADEGETGLPFLSLLHCEKL
jgi:hypothetical protein